ncbi:MAG: helix-turn-helix domain-containing protein [Candidatus Riflebacteria bacterium]|nr:helix-turn-helix domain-containing protein [Candidatus Riflebacteria bacterium]
MTTFETIRLARERLGLTQEEFARVFEVSPRTVIRWENGKSEPQGSAHKKVQVLIELLQNEESAKELLAAARLSNGVEELRSIVNQSGLTSFDSSGGWSPGLGSWSSGSGSFSGRTRASAAPALGGAIGALAGATSMYSAYKLLRRYFAEDSVEGAEYSTQRKCPVCGNANSAELFHCTGMLDEETPCRFVVCKNCIYASKEAHKKCSPTCNRIDVPALEPLED